MRSGKRMGILAAVVLWTALGSAGCVGKLEYADDDQGGGDGDGGNGVADAAPGGGAADAANPGGAPDAAPGPRPGDGLVFISYPPQRGADPRAQGDLMQDVARHLPPAYGDEYYFDEPITWAHETTHGINAELRNHHNNTGHRANGFYVLQDRGVIVEEPNIRKSDANAYVPQALRGFRYDTYLAGQQAWDDTPTYLFDEWVAYTNGGAVGVELVQKGLFGNEWQDGVYGQLEFVVYSMAIGMAAEAGDPTFFAQNTQFREFLAWQARRAMDIFRQGRTMAQFEYDTQDGYFETLRSAPAAKDMRDFIVRTWGQDFLDELLAPL